jgi:hypothetical protein
MGNAFLLSLFFLDRRALQSDKVVRRKTEMCIPSCNADYGKSMASLFWHRERVGNAKVVSLGVLLPFFTVTVLLQCHQLLTEIVGVLLINFFFFCRCRLHHRSQVTTMIIIRDGRVSIHLN